MYLKNWDMQTFWSVLSSLLYDLFRTMLIRHIGVCRWWSRLDDGVPGRTLLNDEELVSWSPGKSPDVVALRSIFADLVHSTWVLLTNFRFWHDLTYTRNIPVSDFTFMFKSAHSVFLAIFVLMIWLQLVSKVCMIVSVVPDGGWCFAWGYWGWGGTGVVRFDIELTCWVDL